MVLSIVLLREPGGEGLAGFTASLLKEGHAQLCRKLVLAFVSSCLS